MKDTEVTSEPKLILVFATIGLASKADYLFMNPNGWYCIDADVNILAKSRIDLHCNARLADTKVNIDLLSHTDGDRSKFGLSVLSKVTVNRVSRVDPKEGC